MKFTATSTALLIFLSLICLPASSQACDLSDYTLDSVKCVGNTYEIYSTLCIGAGVTGTTTGAGGDTRDFAFAVYGSTFIQSDIIGFDSSITGQTTGETYTGITMGANVIGNSQALIAYVDFFGNPFGLTCTFSTALCGTIHQECYPFKFTITTLPDSIRVFGIEGSGNPQAGCFPNPDMVIDFACPATLGTTAIQTNESCLGTNNGSISLTVNGGFPPYYFLWNDSVTTQNRASLSPGNYSVTVSNCMGCIDSTSFAVLPGFTDSLPDTMQTIFGCINDIIQLQASPGQSYQWAPSTGLSCSSCPNPMLTMPALTTLYELTYQDTSGGCQTLLTPTQGLLCSPCDTAQLMASFADTTGSLALTATDLSTSSPQSPLTYIEWNFGDGSGWLPNTPGSTTFHQYAQPGTYNVCLHASAYLPSNICCHDTICRQITITKDTCDGFTADISWAQIPGTLDITFIDSTQPASDISIWDFGDGTSITTNNSGPVSHTYPSPGSYTTTLIAIDHITDSICCIDTSTITVQVLSNVLSPITVYPSNAHETINILLLGATQTPHPFQIHNTLGQSMLSGTLIPNQPLAVDMSHIPTGIYFVSIFVAGKRNVVRFLKQ